MGGDPLAEERVFRSRSRWHRLQAVVVEPEGVRFVRRWGGDAVLTWDELRELTWRDRRLLVLHTRFHEWVIGAHVERLRDLSEAIRHGRKQRDAPVQQVHAGEELRGKLAGFETVEAAESYRHRRVRLRDLRLLDVVIAGMAALLAGTHLTAVAGVWLAALLADLVVRQVWHTLQPPSGPAVWRLSVSDDGLELQHGASRKLVRWEQISAYHAGASGLVVYVGARRALQLPPKDEFAALIDAARPPVPFRADGTPVPDTALSRMRPDTGNEADRGISRSGGA